MFNEYNAKCIILNASCTLHHAQLPQAKVSILFYFCKQNRQNIHRDHFRTLNFNNSRVHPTVRQRKGLVVLNLNLTISQRLDDGKRLYTSNTL